MNISVENAAAGYWQSSPALAPHALQNTLNVKVFAFRALNSLTSAYVVNVLNTYIPPRSFRNPDIKMGRAGHTYAVIALRLWNNLQMTSGKRQLRLSLRRFRNVLIWTAVGGQAAVLFYVKTVNVGRENSKNPFIFIGNDFGFKHKTYLLT